MAARTSYRLRIAIFALPTLVIAFALYLAIAKGLFEYSNRYTLIAQKATSIKSGMPVEFAGIAIGSVTTIELGTDGNVNVGITVPRKQTMWIRSDSAFILEQPVIGSARISVETRDLKNPPLPDRAVRQLTLNNSLDRILAQTDPLVNRLQTLVGNLADPQGPLNVSLQQIAAITGKIAQKGMLETLTNDHRSTEAVIESLTRSRDVLVSVQRATDKLGNLIDATQGKLYGPTGTAAKVDDVLQETVRTLQQARSDLDALGKVLDHANRAGANIADSTENLTSLRQDVDAAVHKTDSILDSVNNIWPLRLDREIKLP